MAWGRKRRQLLGIELSQDHKREATTAVVDGECSSGAFRLGRIRPGLIAPHVSLRSQ